MTEQMEMHIQEMRDTSVSSTGEIAVEISRWGWLTRRRADGKREILGTPRLLDYGGIRKSHAYGKDLPQPITLSPGTQIPEGLRGVPFQPDLRRRPEAA